MANFRAHCRKKTFFAAGSRDRGLRHVRSDRIGGAHFHTVTPSDGSDRADPKCAVLHTTGSQHNKETKIKKRAKKEKGMRHFFFYVGTLIF